MIIRSKAPLRLGLAGGGTDVSPYCDEFGGAVLNVTINKYAYCTIEPTNDGKIFFCASDRGESTELVSTSHIIVDKVLPLHKGVYNRIVADYCEGRALSFKMTTYSEAPIGSGLGSSSTLVVAMIKAFAEWIDLPLGEYDIASLAYKVERKDVGFAGGKQDQYAATFGGFNFIEFYKDDRVIVNPLRVKNWIKNEVENSLIIYYTGTSRDSGEIIEEQIKGISNHKEKSLEGMHELKKSAFKMKEALLKGDFEAVANFMNAGWESKKKTSKVITNPKIEDAYNLIMENGGIAAKISGAGGGGFMMILCNPIKRCNLLNKLMEMGGQAMLVSLTDKGTEAWTLK